MEKAIGFAPEYNYENPDGNQYFYITSNGQKPLDISGYDIMATLYSGRFDKISPDMSFTSNAKNYSVGFNRVNNNETTVFLKDDQGQILISMDLYEKAKGLIDLNTASKDMVDPELLTFETELNGYKMKVVFQNISATLTAGTDAGFDYSVNLMVGIPK
jgi:hypothetical protein